jgi:hypothetical protein
MSTPSITPDAYALACDIKNVMDAVPAYPRLRDRRAVHRLAERALAAGYADTARAIHAVTHARLGNDIVAALGEAALALVEDAA